LNYLLLLLERINDSLRFDINIKIVRPDNNSIVISNHVRSYCYDNIIVII